MNIVVLQGGAGASAQIGRHDGFNRIIKKNKNFKILADFPAVQPVNAIVVINSNGKIFFFIFT